MIDYDVMLYWTDCNGERVATRRTVPAWSSEEAEKHARAMYPTIDFDTVVIVSDRTVASA
jgi:hypothetical protein